MSPRMIPVTVLLIAWATGSAAAPVSAGCSRSCLEGIMNAYLDRLPHHSTAGLPLAPQVNARENAKAVASGGGLWKIANSIKSRDTFADPVTGQVVSFGAADTDNGVGAFFVRLKVVNHTITESETGFNGNDSAFSHPENLLHPDILYDAPVPKDRRRSRGELLKLVESYLDGISHHDGSRVPFNYRCDRYASGAKVTNSPDHPAEREGGTCAGSFQHLTGQPVVNRRFPVIDADRGIVVAMYIIPHGERTPPGATNAGECFKIVDGQIRSIEEFSFGGGWPPDSGYESDPASEGPPP